MACRIMARTLLLGVIGFCLVAFAFPPLSAQSPTPAYVVVGDSIEFGLGDDIAADGMGYVPIFKALLTMFVGQPVEVNNLGEPFAQTRDIWRKQVPDGLSFASGHAPVVVSWGGGGNDLAEVATGPQAAACRREPSCLGRLHGLLNETEETIDRTIRELRQALGAGAVILMRTQYNALLRPGCGTPEEAALATAALEGAPGTLLDRGLNDRIRTVAGKHDAQVVDLFLPFALSANTLVSSDCIHPSGVGYQAVGAISWAAFLAAQ
jgi:lysophospholipase L1-like esterase